MFGANTATSLTKSIGYTNPKTYQFRKAKEDHLNKKQRFKKRTTNALFGGDRETSSQNLLANTNGETIIELGGLGAGALPPAWVDIYDEAQEKTRKIKDIYNDVQKLTAARMKKQFGNHDDLDAQIEKKNLQATNLLQDCEGHLMEISRMGSPNETPNQTQIRKNIEKVLATQIQEIAVVLRKQQKGFLEKMKEQNFTGTLSELNIGSTAEELDEEDMQEVMMAEDLAAERDEDINQIVDSINKLNQLFKEMNRIVIEQGTIVDRIDYNLEKSEDHTNRGKKELGKALKSMNSKCGDSVIRVLIILIMIFSVLLMLKFAKKG